MVTRVACRCGHEEQTEPLTIEFFYGTDFDLVDNAAELVLVIKCEECGSSRPFTLFEPGNIRDHKVPFAPPAQALAS